MSRGRLLLAMLLACLAGALLAQMWPTGGSPVRAGRAEEAVLDHRKLAEIEARLAERGEPSDAFHLVYKAVGPAVVMVFTEHRPTRHSPFLDARPDQGVGSGVIFRTQDDGGFILTNHHVIKNASRITAVLDDGREIPASLVGFDARTDVAVIRIQAPDLVTAPLGDSDQVRVGDWAIAIGSPFGLEQTVTVGIISAKGRQSVTDTGFQDFLQTDAAINGGNSGGPLLNRRGQVIGINTAIATQSGGNEGIGYAIPVNLARDVAEQLIAGRKVTRAMLGISMKGSNEVVVDAVVPGSAALDAGIQPGDKVLSFAGQAVASPRALQRLVARTQPGKEVDIEIMRGKKRIKLTVNMGEMP
jgi:serine protease Do